MMALQLSHRTFLEPINTGMSTINIMTVKWLTLAKTLFMCVIILLYKHQCVIVSQCTYKSDWYYKE